MATDSNCTCGDCSDARLTSLLCELFDPSTSRARADEIRATIESCPECFSRLESEQAVRGRLRECCGHAQVPEPLRQRIITSITSVTTVRVTEVRYR